MWHVDYQIENMAINLSQAAHDQKVLAFASVINNGSGDPFAITASKDQ